MTITNKQALEVLKKFEIYQMKILSLLILENQKELRKLRDHYHTITMVSDSSDIAEYIKKREYAKSEKDVELLNDEYREVCKKIEKKGKGISDWLEKESKLKITTIPRGVFIGSNLDIDSSLIENFLV